MLPRHAADATRLSDAADDTFRRYARRRLLRAADAAAARALLPPATPSLRRFIDICHAR